MAIQQTLVFALLIAAMVSLTSCGLNGSAQSGGSENYGHGHVAIGVPF
jgi:hypothetical protein